VSSTLAWGQNINGTFHGTVSDQTGAVVPGAKVEVKNLSTSQVREATTASNGFYTITDLPPGHYLVSVSKESFATTSQPDVELLVNQDLEADYKLSVGQVTQTIEVTGAANMLQTSNATLGQVVGSTQVVDLPLNGRQFTQLILLTPGAAPKEGGQQSFYQIPIGGGGLSPAMNGSQPTENFFTLDGILNNHYFYQQAAISPPPDAIQEFMAQYHANDAQFGITSGADVNIVTKSGGPTFHGDAWEFLRNSSLDAANYFANFANEPKPPYRQNQYGVTFGGPVILPHYDGRKKQTFFFGYWEGFRSAETLTQFASVPTTAELGGDFSDILTTTPSGASDALGRPILNGQIFNPYSTRQVNAGSVDTVTGLVAQSTGLVRDPFSGNAIPKTMLTSQALAYLNAFYPTPNFGPGGNVFPNVATSRPQTISSDQFGVGLDHTFANNDTLFGKFYFSQPDEIIPTALNIGATDVENHARMAALGYTHIFSPTLVVTAHYGYSWLFSQYSEQPGGVALMNATGFGPALVEQDNYPIVPEISIGPRLSGTSQYAIPQGPMRTHQLNFDIQKVHGSHTLGAGMLYMHVHAYDNGWGSGINYDQYASSGISSAGANQGSTGDGLASMLLNLPSNFSESAGVTGADLREGWIGAYAQDKWQASKKLSVSIGIRWDFATPPHYLNNQFSGWNADCPMGGTYNTPAEITAVEDSCILMPIPFVISPTAANPNPVSWRTPNVRQSLWDPKYNGWQPRLGLAYAVTPKVVVRSGFVIFDDHNQFDKQVQGSRGSWPFGIPSGAEALFTALNRGVPTVFANALPSAGSLLAGSTPYPSVADDIRQKIAYSLEYNLGVEYQITSNTALTVNYVGSETRHVWACCYTYNQPYPNELGPNSFPDALPFPFLNATLAGESNSINGDYNGLQLKLEKRFAKGLSILASYTWSKSLDMQSGDYNSSPQNTYNMRAEWGPSDYNFPQLFSFAAVYQLPVGQGQRFAGNASRALNAVIGGWNVSDITSAHSGSPFTVDVPYDNANAGTTQRANVVPGCPLTPSGFQQNVQHWYNTACFVVPPQYTFGDLGRNTLRGPNSLNFDFSLFKDFKLTESKTLEFRAESFNIFNAVNLAPPGGGVTGAYTALGGSSGTDVATPTFMQIYSAAPGREIQFALKFIF
jgi:hypothetical protein